MIPISDDSHRGIPAWVTWSLIGGCTLVFLGELTLTEPEIEEIIRAYGVTPRLLFGYGESAGGIFPPVTLLTSLFLHGGAAHLFGNMLYLYIFGDNVESAMGHGRFLLFYLICGVAAALTQSLLAPGSTIPLIGASGAISGVLGAYLLLFPRAHVRILFAPLPIPYLRIFSVPAVIVLGFWFLLQLLSGSLSDIDAGGVAFWAHVGGFVAGMALVPIFKRRDVALFQQRSPQGIDLRPDAARRRGPWDRR